MNTPDSEKYLLPRPTVFNQRMRSLTQTLFPPQADVHQEPTKEALIWATRELILLDEALENFNLLDVQQYFRDHNIPLRLVTLDVDENQLEKSQFEVTLNGESKGVAAHLMYAESESVIAAMLSQYTGTTLKVNDYFLDIAGLGWAKRGTQLARSLRAPYN